MSISIKQVLEKLKEGKSIDECGIEVKNYLGILSKQVLIYGNKENDLSNVISSCIAEKNGIAYIDQITLEVYWVCMIGIHYTNIDIDGMDYTEFYDVLMEKGIYDYIVSNIKNENVQNFAKLVEVCLEREIKLINAPEAIAHKYLDHIVKLIPSETKMKNMIKKVENFDPDKLKTIVDLFKFAKNK